VGKNIKPNDLRLDAEFQMEGNLKNVIAKYPNQLEYVKNQTRDICQLAVSIDPFAIQHVTDQSEELCLLAVQQNGMSLRYILHPTPLICLEAITNNKNAFIYADIVSNDCFEETWDNLLQIFPTYIAKKDVKSKMKKVFG
jgi:hypothetical protein